MQKKKNSLKVEVEDLSSVKRRLTVTVPAGEVAQEVAAAYRSVASSASIPGFRKGAVPKNVLNAKTTSMLCI